MSEKTTILDDQINERLEKYVTAYQRTDEARRELNDRQRTSDELEGEMQRLLIARSVLRDGEAYGTGNANVELKRLRIAFGRADR